MHYTLYEILPTSKHTIERNGTRGGIHPIDKLMLIMHVENETENVFICYKLVNYIVIVCA
jgi:hypothetical protein